jgi:site-specific recombinase XerD
MNPAHAPIEPWIARQASHDDWIKIAVAAPQLAASMDRYLIQLTTFLAPRSVDVADSTLRQFARWLTANTAVKRVNEITRTHIEDYKFWLAAQPGTKAPTMSKSTQRQRLRMIRIFFERLIDWDWPDAPRRNPILHGDIPPRPEPLPKFLDDRDAAKLMATARSHPLPRYRIVVEILARTGTRATELCELAADAVTQIGDGYWLRIPVGKLRNDRFVPLHPELVTLLAEWTANNTEHIRQHKRLIADHHAPLDRLGHRSMEMTLTYARIADRTVADDTHQ